MKRSDIKQLPEFFAKYVSLVDDIELSEAFEKSLKQIDDLDIAKLNRIGLKVYADGKWSVNKIIQHFTDWERIWCYRRFFLHAAKVQFLTVTKKYHGGDFKRR